VYFAGFGCAHVMSDVEVTTRGLEELNWKPGMSLSYRMDYFLGIGADCRQMHGAQVAFTDAGEGTCVWRNH
jgi:hypothetical protein